MKENQKIKRRREKKRKKIKILIFLGALVIVILAAYNISKSVVNASVRAKRLEQENAYAKEKEEQSSEEDNKQDESSVGEKTEESKNEQQQEKQNTNKVEDINFKEFFSKDVFVGDSIAEAIDYYGVLNHNSVYAKKGETLVKSMPKITDIASRKPNRIFLMFGMNDIEIYEKSEDFAKKYDEYIKQIKKSMPNTKIYVQSILPVMEKASNNQPSLSDDRIKEFNEALKVVCEKNNVKYIDTYTFTKGLGDDYYEPDGIHFQYKYYPEWLTYIKNNL